MSDFKSEVEWASCVEWASAVELASCQFHAYFRAGRMPTLLLFIQRLTQRQAKGNRQ
ncbi:MAG: hypothetical protein F6J90_16645 [Moorea sp. SIOASIH]|uniref:hypothetical protein n=1 Tax=Moorena sp. SIOASIH TaxID=2607817 RepID=UPI0013BB170C|nr:hypothetical protein [Moorena sp. SIOASIH]NEO37867.1 hypothetical protein [Moorena sp. SIOASIH]